MKKIIYTCVYFLSLSCYGNAQIMDVHYIINESRSALDVSLVNGNSHDVYCEGVNIDITLVDDEFGSPYGGFDLSMGQQYFVPRDKKNFYNVGQEEIKSYSIQNGVAIIDDARVDLVSCRAATFSDYCKFSKKTSSDELTLDQLVKAAKTEKCDDIESKLNGVLDLSESGITSLKPIMYLESLKKLVLNKNNITEVGSLKNLTNLKFLDVSDNSIVKIDDVVALPNIERIKANNTLVEYTRFPKISSTLKKLEIRGTPLEAEMKKGKK